MELARVDFGAITKAELLELVRQGKTPVPQNMPASTNGSGYECPDCQDTGYILGHNRPAEMRRQNNRLFLFKYDTGGE